MCFNQSRFIYMFVLSHDVWILYTGVLYHMMFEREYAGDFMHAFYFCTRVYFMYIPAYVLSQAWLNKTVEKKHELQLTEIRYKKTRRIEILLLHFFRIISYQTTHRTYIIKHGLYTLMQRPNTMVLVPHGLTPFILMHGRQLSRSILVICIGADPSLMSVLILRFYLLLCDQISVKTPVATRHADT